MYTQMRQSLIFYPLGAARKQRIRLFHRIAQFENFNETVKHFGLLSLSVTISTAIKANLDPENIALLVKLGDLYCICMFYHQKVPFEIQSLL